MQLSDLANIVNGKLIGSNNVINHFVINGRKAAPNDCYIALKGDRCDGHDFINQALAYGATSAIVNRVSTHAISLILVDDTLEALSALAAYYRTLFSLPTLALTGSCGKTTVKEMLKCIFPTTAFASPGNLNNHIGVPLSLLALDKHHTHALFELGANHIGEIAHTAALVKPEVGLITNIAPAHLEGFGSIEGVAKAKGELFAALPINGTAVVNHDDKRVIEQSKRHLGKTLTYACDAPLADVCAKQLEIMSDGCYQWQLHYKNTYQTIRLTVPGKHNVSNALAAATSAIAMGVSLIAIKTGLEAFCGVNNRLSIKLSKQGARLIDDSYNANLHSVKAAIDVLAHYKGKRIFVLGELAEAGEALGSHYNEIGTYARAKKLDAFYTCGNQSTLAQQAFGKGGKHFIDKQGLTKALNAELDNASTLLVKGSRSAGMESIIQHLS